MTSRQRVLASLRFEPTDRPPFDLMEGTVWPELLEYFRSKRGCADAEAVQDFLGTDLRWVSVRYPDSMSQSNPEAERAHTDRFAGGVLRYAQSVAAVEAAEWLTPKDWEWEDFQAARQRWPEHALVLGHCWSPLFWGACIAFGMEEALVKMYTQPAVFEAFVARHHQFYMEALARGLRAARGNCDVAWLGDDYASQENLLFAPDLWRKLIKPYLAQQVALLHRNRLPVLFHSCGNVRELLPDFIEIGIDGLLVFQTTARNMDAASIAREFGGKIAFYGGIDVQRLLSFGTPTEVRDCVRENLRLFAGCGGYIVANCHHRVATIRGENIKAMCETAREWT